VAVFEVSYADDRPVERVSAEWLESQGRHWVLMITCVVISRQRAIVALRVPIAGVRAIYQLSSQASGHRWP
jgi:hypothetical protein